MIEIIPAILEKSFDGVVNKIKRIEKEAPDINWAHLDIMDGKFVPNTTWSEPRDLSSFKTSLNLEVHLMIKNPRDFLADWLVLNNVKRILIHKETVLSNREINRIAREVKAHNKEIGLVFNPDTPLESAIDGLIELDGIMLMGVEPGFSGQIFKEEVLVKAERLRQLDKQISIALDGGVSPETVPSILAAGTTRLCAASYLWKSDNFKEAINCLKAIAGAIERKLD